MHLTHEDIEKYIEQISSKTKLIIIGSRSFMFKHPTTMISIRARHVYESEYKEALAEGLLSYDDMKKILVERNVLTEADRNLLASLKSKIEAQKVLLSKITKVKSNQERVLNLIKDLDSKIREIEYKEKSKLMMTAETKAEEAKLLFLCYNCTFNFENNELFWKSYDDFLNETDLMFRQSIISEFMPFYSGIPTEIVRFIARSNLWRIRYVTSLKTSESLFGVPTTEYSNDMLNLAYWSHYYQNIYEMMPEDQPPQNIIEDDVALDAYMEAYYHERNQESTARKAKRKLGSGKLSAFDQPEVIVTRANELYEDVEYDKPKEAQAIKDRTMIQQKVSNKNRVGTIPDQLPHR